MVICYIYRGLTAWSLLLHRILFPILLSRYFILKKREIPQSILLTTVFFINISDELAKVLFFFGLYLTCHYFFPLPEVTSQQNLSATQLWKAFSSSAQGSNFYGQHPWQFFITTSDAGISDRNVSVPNRAASRSSACHSFPPPNTKNRI